MQETDAAVLTDSQIERLRDRANELTSTEPYREELARRHEVAQRFRKALEDAGVWQGRALTRDGLAELVRLQKQVQNLNPVVLPRFMGTYAYYRNFKGFEGDEADFVAHMRAKRPDWPEGSTGYPGVELESFTRELCTLLSADDAEIPRALSRFLEQESVGIAFASGAMHLHDPGRFPIINGGSKGPFVNEGPWQLNADQRRELLAKMPLRFERGAAGISARARRALAWIGHFETVRELCQLEDYVAVDYFVWWIHQGVRKPTVVGDLDSAELEALLDELDRFLDTVDPETIRVRREAEAEARALIHERLGRLTEDDVRRLYQLFNQDWGRGALRRSRFSPAFTGISLQDALDSLDALNRWLARLWQAEPDQVANLLDEFWAAREIPNAGRALPTIILHLKDPERYQVLVASTGQGAARLLGRRMAGRSGATYRTFNKAANELRTSRHIPVELVDMALWKLARIDLGQPGHEEVVERERVFQGFQPDTFAFFRELGADNSSSWYDSANRSRFRNRVKEPMRRLVTDVGTEFFAAFAPDLEREPKSPQTLSQIRKNVYGRKEDDVYWEHMWAAFHRKSHKKTEDFQLFVFLRAERVAIGFSTMAASKADVARFYDRLQENRELASRILDELRAAGLHWLREDQPPGEYEDRIPELDELLSRRPERVDIGRWYPPDDPVVLSPRLVDEAIETYAAVYPLFLFATQGDAASAIAAFEEAWTGGIGDETDDEDSGFTLEQLLEETLLAPERVETLVDLLSSKGQLIFYGPPGTGKTWLAERFALYLAGPSGEVKTIQFHPSYSYEDFVEGIRPTLSEGQVSYEVVPGIFRRLCDDARRRPKARFVLVIDEINRGNLPRIFGELLYLLERRGKEVELPVSSTSFSIPPNIVLIGTMNTADQSIAFLDMALRRRFHFERFNPDSDLLGAWLDRHRPDMRVAAEVLDRVNGLLSKEGVSHDRWIGHSHLMDPELDEEQLERIWSHSVLPTIEELFYGQPERLQGFTYEALVEPMLGAQLSADTIEEETLGDDPDID